MCILEYALSFSTKRLLGQEDQEECIQSLQNRYQLYFQNDRFLSFYHV